MVALPTFGANFNQAPMLKVGGQDPFLPLPPGLEDLVHPCGAALARSGDDIGSVNNVADQVWPPYDEETLQKLEGTWKSATQAMDKLSESHEQNMVALTESLTACRSRQAVAKDENARLHELLAVLTGQLACLGPSWPPNWSAGGCEELPLSPTDLSSLHDSQFPPREPFLANVVSLPHATLSLADALSISNTSPAPIRLASLI